MTTVEAEAVIRAPLETVFAAITDPQRGLEWNGNIVDVGPISGLPLGEGSTWTQVATVLGRPMTFQCRIVRWNPPHEGVLVIAGPQRAELRTRCEAVPGGTRVLQRMDFEPPGGMLGSMLGGAIAPRLRQELNDTLARQRATLEREVGGM